MTVNSQSLSKDVEARQHWISVLSRSNADELQSYWQAVLVEEIYKVLRKPETGLIMVRGRAGGRGQRFNLGEATVTRCTVMLESGQKGHGYVMGRSERHAEMAALFDACLQKPELYKTLTKEVIESIEQRLESERQARRVKVAATKVDFYTMARGEDS